MEIQFSDVQKEEKVYSKKEVIEILHNNLKTVSDFYHGKIPNNKYLKLAVDYNYNNYRVGTVGDLYTLGLLKSFSEYHKGFFNEHGVFLAIFNELNGKPISIIFRGIDKKDFMDYSIYYCLYGLDKIDPNFKYGDWLCITEGIYDSDVYRTLYINTLSMLTSSVTTLQMCILSSLTNKFVLAFDNDKAGEEGAKVAERKLKEYIPNAVIEKLPIYTGDKDLGMLEECNVAEKMEKITYYKSVMDLLTEGGEGECSTFLG